MQSKGLIRCLPWLSASLLVASGAAQVMQPTGTFPPGPRQRQIQPPPQQHEKPSSGAAEVHTGAVASPAPAAPPANVPLRAPSLLDKPAQPASVSLQGGVLVVHANNSSLSDILHQLGSSSGMTIDGFQKDQRVFGVYGPGSPRDVLSSLLMDAGYNFLLVGTTEKGTPKQVILTARSGGGPSSAAPAQPEMDAQPDEDNGDNDNNFPPPEPNAPDSPSTPPGAVATPPTAPEGRVKTPAEIIQELQRMRQQQQNPQ
jgi:hypothetical protein